MISRLGFCAQPSSCGRWPKLEPERKRAVERFNREATEEIGTMSSV